MNANIFRISAIIVTALLLNACKDEREENTIFSRLFRPASFSTEINGNTVIFSWTPIANARYELEISRDSFLYTNELQTFSLEQPEFTIENLWSQSRYSARVKAVSRNEGMGDSGFKEISFLTGIENIFYQPAADNIYTNSVLVRWDSSKEVTHIVIATGIAPGVSVTLSSTDVDAGEKLIEGLQAGTTYTLEIYKGEMKRGEIAVSTKPN